MSHTHREEITRVRAGQRFIAHRRGWVREVLEIRVNDAGDGLVLNTTDGHSTPVHPGQYLRVFNDANR